MAQRELSRSSRPIAAEEEATRMRLRQLLLPQRQQLLLLPLLPLLRLLLMLRLQK